MINKFEIGDALTSSILNSARVKYICPEDYKELKTANGGWQDCISMALKQALEENKEFKCEQGCYNLTGPIIIDYAIEETNYTKKIKFDCDLKVDNSSEEGLWGNGNNYVFIFRPTGNNRVRIRNQNFYFRKITSTHDSLDIGGILIQPIYQGLFITDNFTDNKVNIPEINEGLEDPELYRINYTPVRMLNYNGFSFNTIEMDNYEGNGSAVKIDATYSIVTTTNFKGLRWHSTKAPCVEMYIGAVKNFYTQKIINRSSFLTEINFYDVEFYTEAITNKDDIERYNHETHKDDFLKKLYNIDLTGLTTDDEEEYKKRIETVIENNQVTIANNIGTDKRYRAIKATTENSALLNFDLGSKTEIEYNLFNVNLEDAGGIYHKNLVAHAKIDGCRIIEQANRNGWLYLDYGLKPEFQKYYIDENDETLSDLIMEKTEITSSGSEIKYNIIKEDTQQRKIYSEKELQDQIGSTTGYVVLTHMSSRNTKNGYSNYFFTKAEYEVLKNVNLYEGIGSDFIKSLYKSSENDYANENLNINQNEVLIINYTRSINSNNICYHFDNPNYFIRNYTAVKAFGPLNSSPNGGKIGSYFVEYFVPIESVLSSNNFETSSLFKPILLNSSGDDKAFVLGGERHTLNNFCLKIEKDYDNYLKLSLPVGDWNGTGYFTNPISFFIDLRTATHDLTLYISKQAIKYPNYNLLSPPIDFNPSTAVAFHNIDYNFGNALTAQLLSGKKYKINFQINNNSKTGGQNYLLITEINNNNNILIPLEYHQEEIKEDFLIHHGTIISKLKTQEAYGEIHAYKDAKMLQENIVNDYMYKVIENGTIDNNLRTIEFNLQKNTTYELKINFNVDGTNIGNGQYIQFLLNKKGGSNILTPVFQISNNSYSGERTFIFKTDDILTYQFKLFVSQESLLDLIIMNPNSTTKNYAIDPSKIHFLLTQYPTPDTITSDENCNISLPYTYYQIQAISADKPIEIEYYTFF